RGCCGRSEPRHPQSQNRGGRWSLSKGDIRDSRPYSGAGRPCSRGPYLQGFFRCPQTAAHHYREGPPGRGLDDSRHRTRRPRPCGRGGRGGGGSRYMASGPGVSPVVKVDGNTISLQGTLPAAFKGAEQVAVYAEVQNAGTPATTIDQVPPRAVTLTGIQSAEV